MKESAAGRHLVLTDGDAVSGAIEEFRHFALERRLSAKLVSDFCIVIDELLSNIIRYGYRGGPAHVELSMRMSGETLELEIVDSAPRFNMLERREPSTNHPLSERAIGGLGIFLVRKLSDEVRYDFVDGQNRLHIRKRV